MNIGHIIEGWRNHLIPPQELKETIDKVSEYRLSICTPCDYNSTPDEISTISYCKKCKCPLKAKSKSLSSKCPISKWLAYTTDEERVKIDAEIKKYEEDQLQSPDSSNS